MDHDGPCAGRVGDLDPADEGQQAGGVIWNSVVRPAGEVELLHFPELVKTSLGNQKYSTFQSRNSLDICVAPDSCAVYVTCSAYGRWNMGQASRYSPAPK